VEGAERRHRREPEQQREDSRRPRQRLAAKPLRIQIDDDSREPDAEEREADRHESEVVEEDDGEDARDDDLEEEGSRGQGAEPGGHPAPARAFGASVERLGGR
jgi:hypothetical protein